MSSKGLRGLDDYIPFTNAVTSAGWGARLMKLGVGVEERSWTSGRPRTPGRRATKVWAEGWAVRIFEAEPVLPDAREAALQAALTDESIRLAVLGAYAMGGRVAVATLIQERFG